MLYILLYTSNLFTKDLKWIENNGDKQWSSFDDNAHTVMNPDDVSRINREAAKNIPLGDAIKITRGTNKFSFVVYSGVDCSACITMEKILAKTKGISYYVMPGAIHREKNIGMAKRVWCAKNRQSRAGSLPSSVLSCTPSPVLRTPRTPFRLLAISAFRLYTLGLCPTRLPARVSPVPRTSFETCHRPLPRRGPATVPVQVAVCCLRRDMSGSALPNTFRLIM